MAVGIKMAIVPQLVPVANEVIEATTNRIAGNHEGEILSARIVVRKSPVPRLSQQFLSDQARINIKDGIIARLIPRSRHLQTTGKRNDPNISPQSKASVIPKIAAEKRTILLFLALLITSRQ